MRYSRSSTLLALLVLCAAALLYAVHVPSAGLASPAQKEFYVRQAMMHVEAIAQRPHPLGSADQVRVREYIMGEIAALGLSPQVQEATGVGTRYPVAGRVRNILVRVPGTQPGGKAVLLMAHYDGVPAGPAAGDDGSGTAVLLETLRALKAGGPLVHDVIALFTDGEEAGMLGAAAFARQHPWAKDVAVVLNFEARGTNGPSMMFETGQGNLDVVRVLRRLPGVRATSLSTTVYRMLPNDTDLSEMAVLQQPAMNFAFIGGVQRYHTAEDDVTHLSTGSVQHHGNQAVALARAFGTGPLPRPQTSDAVFFNLPLLGVVVYPQALALPFAVVVLLIAAGGVALRRREPRWIRDTTIGAAGVVVSVLAAAGVGAATVAAVSRLHASMQNGGDPRWSVVYAAAVALLSVAIVLVVFAVSRRVASTRGIVAGALLALSAINIYVCASIPGVSFLLTWPLFFTAVAALAAVTGTPPRVAQAIGWVAAAVVIFLLAPTIYLMVVVALGLDIVGAALLAILTAVAASLLILQLEVAAGARAWRPTLIAAGAAVLLLAAGAATVRSDAKHPAGASLVYAVDGDSLGAWLTGNATTASARQWLQESLAAISDTGSASGAPEWLTRSHDSSRIVRVPVAALEAPTATLLSDSTRTDGRILTLRIRAGSGAREVRVVATQGNVDSAWVDGLHVDRSRYRSRSQRWGLEYVAPPDSGFTLRLSLPPGGPAALALTSRHDGIPTLQGIRMPVLPQGIIPIQEGNISIVYRRVRL